MDNDTFSTMDIYELEMFKNYSPKLIERTINKRIKELKMESTKQYQEFIEKNIQERSVLLALLKNGYSEFFREPFAFAIMENRVFPDLFSRSKETDGLRMWSVGCSTGQEAYSILMLASEVSRLFKTSKSQHLYATDISQKALEQARVGIYSRQEVRKVPLGFMDTYFEQERNAFLIVSDIKQRVSFLHYNILDPDTLCPPETIYGHFDLIICCNLLIYYDQKAQSFIIDKLIKTLAPGGYLIVGEAERAILLEREEISPLFKSSPVFRKNTTMAKERDAK